MAAYITLAETMEILDKSKSTVFRLVKKGKLTPHCQIKNPRILFFSRAQVESLNRVVKK